MLAQPPTDQAWIAATESVASQLHRDHPSAIVRIVVLEPTSGRLIAGHGPIDVAQETGSTMKTLTAGAAVQLGTTGQTEFDCSGTVTLGTREFHDHAPCTRTSLASALASSSNVAFVRLVQRHG